MFDAENTAELLYTQQMYDLETKFGVPHTVLVRLDELVGERLCNMQESVGKSIGVMAEAAEEFLRSVGRLV